MPASGERASFSSTWGTVLATAGVAIGLGNIWRFPYMMGEYGGAAFLFAYLFVMIAFAVPALMVEWALGRSTQRGTWASLSRAGLPGGKWWSGLLLLTVTMAASYYAVVLAWVLHFAVGLAWKAVQTTASAPNVEAFTASAAAQCLYVLITICLGCAILLGGARSGIERVSKAALPIFFLIFVLLIVRSLTLDGADAGLRTFLVPRWRDFRGSTALAAFGQAYFSLGLGGTFMVVYGSYMRSDVELPKTALLTGLMDAGAAIMAGLIVVPAAAAAGVPLASGWPLMFKVMPEVFQNMPAGNLFGSLFFFSVFVVAMLSLIAAYEVIVAAASDALAWPRRRTLWLILFVEVILAVPAIVYPKYIAYSDFIWGSTMQPVGSALSVVAMAWCLGRAKTLGELRANSSLPVPTWLYYWIKFGIPVGIASTLIYGWIDR